jgi:glycerol-3-phosphate O-acyltransferase / dihydroxyacetone phosphate acyltransferase
LELERSGKEVRASTHLAEAYGGRLQEERDSQDDALVNPEPRGWRNAREVVQFLRDKGAKIGELGHKVEGDWAAASSDVDGDGADVASESEADDDVVWVPSGQT